MAPGKVWPLVFLGRKLKLATVLQDDDTLQVTVQWAGVEVRGTSEPIAPIEAKGVRFMAAIFARKMQAQK